MGAVSQYGQSGNGRSMFNPVPIITNVLNVSDNMWAYNSFVRNQGFAFSQLSAFAELSIQTLATTIDVTGGSTLVNQKLQSATVSVYVNGSYNQLIQYTSAEYNTLVTKTINLPAGNKTVMFRLGSEEESGVNVLGQGITKLQTPSGTSINIITPVRKNKRFLIWGDSKTVGVASTRPEQNAYINVMRADSRMSTYEVVSYGWGGNSFLSMIRTPALRSSLLAEMIAYFNGASDITLLSELSTNDYGLGGATVAQINSWLPDFLNQLQAALPNLKIIIQTADPRASEVANSSGSTLGNYRTALENIAAGRSNTTVVKGPDITVLGDYSADGLHEGNYGYMKKAEFYTRYILGIPQDAPVVFNGQYLKTDPTINGNISFSSFPSLQDKGNVMIDWVSQRPRTSQNDYIFAQGYGAGALFLGWANTNVFRVSIFGRATSSIDLPVGVANVDLLPHHWAIVITNQFNIEIYEDSFLVGTATFTFKQANATNSSAIGAYYSSATTGIFGSQNIDRFRVRISDTHIFNRTDVINSKNTITLTDLTYIAAAYDFTGNANDVSGNNFNGNIGSTVTFPTV